MMAYRVAAEAADLVASIAPARPMPVLYFHVSLDQFTPLDVTAIIRTFIETHPVPSWGRNPRGSSAGAAWAQVENLRYGSVAQVFQPVGDCRAG